MKYKSLIGLLTVLPLGFVSCGQVTNQQPPIDEPQGENIRGDVNSSNVNNFDVDSNSNKLEDKTSSNTVEKPHSTYSTYDVFLDPKLGVMATPVTSREQKPSDMLTNGKIDGWKLQALFPLGVPLDINDFKVEYINPILGENWLKFNIRLTWKSDPLKQRTFPGMTMWWNK